MKTSEISGNALPEIFRFWHSFAEAFSNATAHLSGVRPGRGPARPFGESESARRIATEYELAVMAKTDSLTGFAAGVQKSNRDGSGDPMSSRTTKVGRRLTVCAENLKATFALRGLKMPDLRPYDVAVGNTSTIFRRLALVFSVIAIGLVLDGCTKCGPIWDDWLQSPKSCKSDHF
jgi:hypothetical protein